MVIFQSKSLEIIGHLAIKLSKFIFEGVYEGTDITPLIYQLGNFGKMGNSFNSGLIAKKAMIYYP